MTFKPTPSQRKVIDARDPVVLVLAGAGKGKTVTAAAAARVHLQDNEAEQHQVLRAAWAAGQRMPIPASPRVLFLSFSRSAVAQIHDRSAAILAGYRERIDITTFHGFAWRLVQQWGRHIGLPSALSLVGTSEQKLLGSGDRLTYDDLIPHALEILNIPQIARHYQARYSLVICDEFQDTEDQEWQLVRSIAPQARLILLGDLNQCIYTFKHLRPAERIKQAEGLHGAITISLTEGSQRDPSQVLPAAAEAVLKRKFADPAIRTAVEQGRLVVIRTSDEDGTEAVAQAVRDARDQHFSVSVFTHGNAETAELSQELVDRGVLHQGVGFGEAYAEALSAQLALLSFAFGKSPFSDARARLAVFVCSSIRSRTTPQLAHDLLEPMPGVTNDLLIRRLNELAEQLATAGAAGDFEKVALLVTNAHGHLLLQRGADHWSRAAVQLGGLTSLVSESHDLSGLQLRIEALRAAGMTNSVVEPRAKVQVMNLHQTKGREADVTVMLAQDRFFGKEREPFPENSRLMYVVLTRARRKAVIVAAGAQHQLIAPLIDACI